MRSASNPEQWKRIQSLFEEAAQLSGSDREEFISNLSNEDKKFEDQLRLLLKGDEVADAVLDELSNDITAITSSLNLVGRQIAQYKVIRHIGEGGMGEVYLAEDINLNRKVALKFLPPQLANDKLLNKRFLREAQSAATLSHPNIVAIHETSTFQGRAFIAMEYIEGVTLRELIKEDSTPFDQKLELALQLCSALEIAHASGVIHRDIKPGNIMIDRDNRLYLVDFGLVSLQDEDKLTKTGSLMGTPAYMSPEQIHGKELDQTSDIFSVGSVFHELFTGKQAFGGDSLTSTMNAVLSQEPKYLPVSNDTSKGLGAVLEKALQKNHKNRFQSIKELKDELTKIKDGRYSEVVTSPRKIKRIRDIGIAVAVVSLVVLLFILNPWSLKLENSNELAMIDNSLAIMYLNNLIDRSDSSRTSEIISSLLMTDLGESRHLKTVDRSSLNDALKSQSLDRRSSISSQQAAQVALEVGARWFVIGDIKQLDPSFIISTQIRESSSGTLLSSQEIIGAEGESIYSVVDSLAIRLRKSLKIPDMDEFLYDLDISELTTHSLQGYNCYLEGLEHLESGSKPEAEESFLKALQQDSSFAMAYYYLSELGVDLEQRNMIDSAMKYIAHTSSKETHLIRGAFASLRENDLIKQRSELLTALELAPFDKKLQEAIARIPEQTLADSTVNSASSPPTISIATTPVRNELNVQVDANISVTFDMDMNETTINDSTFVVSSRHTGLYRGAIRYDSSSRTATLNPDINFYAGELVSVVLTTGVTSSSGETLVGGYTFGFSVATRPSGELRPQMTYPIGHSLAWVDAGDLDGDMDIDLVLSGGDTVTILLNDGTGSFSSGSIISTNPDRGCSNLADLDSDGDLDLISTFNRRSMLFVRMNDGTGSFGGATAYTTGSFPLEFITIGDWNNDGYTDFAVPNFLGRSFSIFMNNGDGTLAPRVDYPRGARTHGLCSGDFDEDGDLDIAVSDHHDSLVTIYTNSGTGIFVADGSYQVNGWPMKTLSTDYDSDGHLDIVTVNWNFSGGSISILLGDGLGSFIDSSTAYINLRLRGLDVGDIDGDGVVNPITSIENKPLAAVHASPAGSVTLTSIALHSVGSKPIYCIEVADLDADGTLDIITPNAGSMDISILFNTVAGMEVLSTNPTSNQLVDDHATNISITFGTKMDPSTIDGSTFLINSTSLGSLSGQIRYDSRSRTATFNPDRDFVAGEQVFVGLTSGIRSLAGDPLEGGYSFVFSIAP